MHLLKSTSKYFSVFFFAYPYRSIFIGYRVKQIVVIYFFLHSQSVSQETYISPYHSSISNRERVLRNQQGCVLEKITHTKVCEHR